MRNIFQRYSIKILSSLLSVCLLISLVACNDSSTSNEWEWDEDKTDNADKPRYIWIDAGANFPDFANSKENIKRDLTLAKESGFTHVVVDVRPTCGDALFQTSIVDQVKWLGAWVSGVYTKVERTATWDYLEAFIEASKELDLKVYAAINTMPGGNMSSLGGHGMLYREADKKEWATGLLTTSGIVNTMDRGGTGAKFLNPLHDEVQEYLLSMLEDLAAYDQLDGIILDRGRFDNFQSDFSGYSRQKFEEYLGFSIANFPEDVMTPGIEVGNLPSPLPPYFKQWLEFRALGIHDFMVAARNRVKSVNNSIDFGVYVGGWYSTYYEVGVNWASPDYNTASHYPQWASSKYQEAGYADHMDIMLIGAYASPTRVYGSSEWSIQGFCSLAKEKIRQDAIVAGGPDIGNGAWATEPDDVVNSAIVQSVDAAINACDGYFLFDMIHLKQKDQWEYVQQGIEDAIGEEIK